MRTSNHRLRRGFALATMISAIAVPTAAASPVQEPGSFGQGGSRQLESTPLTVQVEPRPVADDGFDWGDAGIGASAMLALGAIAGGAAIAVGHNPRRGHKLA